MQRRDFFQQLTSLASAPAPKGLGRARGETPSTGINNIPELGAQRRLFICSEEHYSGLNSPNWMPLKICPWTMLLMRF